MKLVATINETKPQKEITYPCLMKWRTTDLIVLFETKNRGMVVGADKGRNLGAFDTGWASAEDEACWEPFYGVVSLKMTKE